MAAPYTPFIGKAYGGHQDYQGFELRRATLWNLSATLTSTLGGTPPDGAFGYRTNAGAKRLVFYDATAVADIEVPRKDYAETVSGLWTFSRSAGTPPFATTPTLPSTGSQATMVTNLNANYLRGYIEDGASATANTIALRDSNGRIKTADPSAAADAVNLGYMQAYIAGIRDPKDAARVATTGNLVATRLSNTLTANANGSINTAGIDGITTLAVNDRVLLKNQTAGADNGIWIITNLGSAGTPWVMQRSSDADVDAEVTNGLNIWVTAGTLNGSSGWLLTTPDPFVLNTAALTFIQVNGSSGIIQGNGIVISGNTIHFAQSGAYNTGGFFYATGSATVGHTAALSGLVLGNGTSAPTAVTTGNSMVLVTNGSGVPSWQTDIPTAVTIGTAYIYRVGGTDVAVADGGTNISSYAVGDILYASGATTLSKLADVATGNALISGGIGVAPAWGKITLTGHVSGTLPVASGGTNITSYVIGDILYASATTTLASLADVATGNALISGGIGVAPLWGKVGLTTHVSGTLPVANGGTGTTTAFTAGSVIFAGAAGVYSQDNANLFFDDAGNNLGLGVNTFGTSAAKVLAIGNGTAPTTAPIDIVQMWSADYQGIAAQASLYIRPEGGTTLFSFSTSGRITASDAIADVTDKVSRWSSGHYTNAEEPFTWATVLSNVSTNVLTLGGGTASGNAATDVRIVTAATSTTVTGTIRWAYSSTGHYTPFYSATSEVDAAGYDIGGSSNYVRKLYVRQIQGNVLMTTVTGTAFTQGSVIFAGAAGVLTQDVNFLTYDATNKSFAVGATTSAAIALYIYRSGVKTVSDYAIRVDSVSTSTTDALNKFGGFFSATGAWGTVSGTVYGVFISAVSGGASANWAIYNSTATDVFLGTGRLGLGSIPGSTTYFRLGGVNVPSSLSGTAGYGVYSDPIWLSNHTSEGAASMFILRTQATAFTMGSGVAVYAGTPGIGAGSTVTNIYAFRALNQGVSGTTNSFALHIAAQSGSTTNWAIYCAGTTEASYFGHEVRIGSVTSNSKLSVVTNGLGVTQTNTSGLALVNETAATSGNQQISPALRLRGYGWKTDATAASQSVDFRLHVMPVQGAANPSGYLSYQADINGLGYTELFRIGNTTLTASSVLHLNSNKQLTSVVVNATASTYFLTQVSSGTPTFIDLFGANNTWTGTNTFNGAVTVPTPTTAGHAATKAYVDAIGIGLRVKDPVAAATTADLPTDAIVAGVLTATAVGNINAAGIDGVTTLIVGSRILVKDQAVAAENGIFQVTTVGDGATKYVLTRTSDANEASELTVGCYTFVQSGTANVSTSWVQELAVVTVDTSAVEWNLFYQGAAYINGVGITISGLTISIDQTASLTWTGAHIFKNSAGLALDPYSTSTGNTTSIRFMELAANGSNYVGFKAPDAVTNNTVWTLPNGDGSANHYLKTSGAGVLSFSQITSAEINNGLFVTSVSGTAGRITVTGTLTPVVDISATYVGQATITTLGTITAGTWNGTAVGTAYGGTGLTSIGTANQVLGTNNAANGLEYKSILGTTNQVTVTHAANSITLSTPQNIHTAATPTFAGMTLSGLTAGSVLFAGTSGVVSQDNANLFWDDAANELRATKLYAGPVGGTAGNVAIYARNNTAYGAATSGFGIYIECVGSSPDSTAIFGLGSSVLSTSYDGNTFAVYGIAGADLATGFAVGVYGVVNYGSSCYGVIGFANISQASSIAKGVAGDCVAQAAVGSAYGGWFTTSINGGGTITTGYAGYFSATGATNNYAIYVAAGTVNFGQLTGPGLLQLNASEDVILSNDLPAGTTINSLSIVRKYTTVIGDAVASSFTVTHALSSRHVVVRVFQAATPYAEIEPEIEHVTTSAVTVRFGFIPASGEFEVVVLG